jgi:hypothetical protein
MTGKTGGASGRDEEEERRREEWRRKGEEEENEVLDEAVDVVDNRGTGDVRMQL